MPRFVRRVLLALLLILGLAPGTCVYRTGRPWNDHTDLTFTAIALPPRAKLARHLGAFELEGAWWLRSPYSGFGGYSALLALPDGRLLAVSDNGRRITFSPPGGPPLPTESGAVLPQNVGRKFDRDVEAATRDPATGTIWLARESINAISRHDPAFRHRATVFPAALRGWGDNAGPEAMTRLHDGRFAVIQEGYSSLVGSPRHRAVLFARDPLLGGKPWRFTFLGPPSFSPTDMAELPDGRVLVLMRRLVWPLPLRFAGRLVIADPAEIRPGGEWRGREVAKLSSSLPVDNFEGMAIAPRSDGRVTVWLISDMNNSATQRTLLWKLAVDPARLPRARKKARGVAPRP